MDTHNTRSRDLRKNIIIGIILTAVVCGIMLMMYLVTDYLNHSKAGAGKPGSNKEQSLLQDTSEQPQVFNASVLLGFQRLL